MLLWLPKEEAPQTTDYVRFSATYTAIAFWHVLIFPTVGSIIL